MCYEVLSFFFFLFFTKIYKLFLYFSWPPFFFLSLLLVYRPVLPRFLLRAQVAERPRSVVVCALFPGLQGRLCGQLFAPPVRGKVGDSGPHSGACCPAVSQDFSLQIQTLQFLHKVNLLANKLDATFNGIGRKFIPYRTL